MLFCYSSCTQQVKEYLKKEFEKHGYSHNDTHHELMVDDIFKNEDEDKDGFISTREFVYQHDELWTDDLKTIWYIVSVAFKSTIFMYNIRQHCCLTCLWNLKIFALFLEIHDIFILISLVKSSKIYLGYRNRFFKVYIFLKYLILNHNKKNTFYKSSWSQVFLFLLLPWLLSWVLFFLCMSLAVTRGRAMRFNNRLQTWIHRNTILAAVPIFYILR